MKKTVKRATPAGKKRTIQVYAAPMVKRVAVKKPAVKRKTNPRPQFVIQQVYKNTKMNIGFFPSETLAKTTCDLYNANSKSGAKFVVKKV